MTRLGRGVTPWARKALTPEQAAEIERDTPPSVEWISLGKSDGGWTCRLGDAHDTLGEAYKCFSPYGAWVQAIADMKGKAA